MAATEIADATNCLREMFSFSAKFPLNFYSDH
jgi:hypothetical protein